MSRTDRKLKMTMKQEEAMMIYSVPRSIQSIQSVHLLNFVTAEGLMHESDGSEEDDDDKGRGRWKLMIPAHHSLLKHSYDRSGQLNDSHESDASEADEDEEGRRCGIEADDNSVPHSVFNQSIQSVHRSMSPFRVTHESDGSEADDDVEGRGGMECP